MTDLYLSEKFETGDGVVRWGNWGSGPPLVLLHGTPFSAQVWGNLVEVFANDHQVFAWDMLGYGQSEKHDGQDVSLPVQTEIFEALLGWWGLDSPDVVGHDFGGTVALRTHLLRSAGYGKLVLVDPVALAPWGSPFFRLVGEHSEVFTQIPPKLHEALVREYVSSASSAGIRPAVLEQLVAPWLDAAGQAAFYRQIAQADQRFTDDIQSRYRDIDIPVLVCWGVDDEWIPVAKAHELVDLIPEARLRLVPAAGHLVQEDAPDLLLSMITDFLAGHPN